MAVYYNMDGKFNYLDILYLVDISKNLRYNMGIENLKYTKKLEVKHNGRKNGKTKG